MSSTNFVDFSVRQNKSIERLIVFENLRLVVDTLSLRKLVYVGLGSVWFADFVLAHRELRIETMISVESDATIYARAKFNKPYRTLTVIEGQSAAIIPELLRKPTLASRPWIVWLDYDKAIDEARRDEIAFLLRNLPTNSSLLVTCNAQGNRYGGTLANRVSYLEELFGDAVEDGLVNTDMNSDTKFMNVLRTTLERYMASIALQGARPGGYEPAFSVAYQDGTPMVTVGGFLPSPENVPVVTQLVGSIAWTGKPSGAITTPPLTPKEVAALQAQLPRPKNLTRQQVQRLGFDLDDDQIAAFERYYLKYPVFAQVAR